MSMEQNKATALRAMDALDQRNVDGVVAECAASAAWHGFTPMPLNNDGYRGAIQMFLDAFPDSRFPVGLVVAEGDKVVVQHSLKGTHRAPFQGVPATGKPVVVPAIATFRFAGGKIVEVWLNADLVSLLMQIGAIPSPA
jgi:steroid delta-isomerase-like uncharacterized protein